MVGVTVLKVVLEVVGVVVLVRFCGGESTVRWRS